MYGPTLFSHGIYYRKEVFDVIVGQNRVFVIRQGFYPY